MRLKKLQSPIAIRKAIEEFDRVGRVYFLEKYGFSKAREYMLREPATGKLYDSKAIVGAAYGYAFPEEGPLTSADFSGGEATVEHLLTELDFQVVRIGQDWTAEEVEATVSDYFEMLHKEAAGLPYSKAEHNEHLRAKLITRSKASIELKHQNISAVLDQLGLPYIRGYKPRSNLQELLRQVVVAYIGQHQTKLASVMDDLDAHTSAGGQKFLGALVTPPMVKALPVRGKRQRLARKFDYAQRDEHNRRLGHNGEAWTLSFERERLMQATRLDLAEKIDWISDRLGDGAGYDILSFEDDEQARFIEVKTTNGGSLTPFVVTRNELEFSEETEDAFCLYRLFEFSSKPQLFILRGALPSNLELEALDYRARLKALS
ncbi:MAG: DUF3883 domain-containing protein [Castellaniella sp.]|nr:DUF3883 domain-containing protein [Castellaniella sp.]